jgi:hypothetical protein
LLERCWNEHDPLSENKCNEPQILAELIPRGRASPGLYAAPTHSALMGEIEVTSARSILAFGLPCQFTEHELLQNAVCDIGTEIDCEDRRRSLQSSKMSGNRRNIRIPREPKSASECRST